MIEPVRAETRVFAAVAVAALAVSLAACSSSSGGHSTSSSTASHSSSSSSALPASTSPSTTPSVSQSVTPAEITKGLLTPADIGLTGATSSPASTADHALPCDPDTGKSLNQQVPATARAGVDITDDALQVAFSEEIRFFADTGTAAGALTAAETGLLCTSGSLRADDGTAVPAQIKPAVDISADLAKDTKLNGVPIAAALVWQATTADENVDLALVQINQSLVLFTFQSTTTADTSKLPNPESVIEAGLEKFISN